MANQNGAFVPKFKFINDIMSSVRQLKSQKDIYQTTMSSFSKKHLDSQIDSSLLKGLCHTPPFPPPPSNYKNINEIFLKCLKHKQKFQKSVEAKIQTDVTKIKNQMPEDEYIYSFYPQLPQTRPFPQVNHLPPSTSRATFKTPPYL